MKVNIKEHLKDKTFHSVKVPVNYTKHNESQTQFNGKDVTAVQQSATNMQPVNQERQPANDLSSYQITKQTPDATEKKDTSIEDNLKLQIAQCINKHKSTRDYKKFRTSVINNSYEFLKEKNLQTFIEIYKLGLKLKLVKKPLALRFLSAEKIVEIGINDYYKSAILKELQESYDSAFSIIYTKIQSASPQLQGSALEKATTKVAQLFKKLISTELTSYNYNLAAEEYLPNIENTKTYDLLTSVVTPQNIDNHESITRIRAIIIASVFHKFEIKPDVLIKYSDTCRVSNKTNISQQNCVSGNEEAPQHTTSMQEEAPQHTTSMRLVDQPVLQQSANDLSPTTTERNLDDNQPQNTSILKQIGRFIIKIIMFPINLLRIFCSWLANLISSYCNKKTDQTSHAETSAIPEDLNITDNLDDKGNTLTKNENCSLYEDDRECFSDEEDNLLEVQESSLPQQNASPEEDVSCEEDNLLEVLAQQDTPLDVLYADKHLAAYKSTKFHQKARAEIALACYQFLNEKLFDTFYEIYKFDTKLKNKRATSVLKKRPILPKKIKEGTLKKQKILKALKQFYDGVFDSIFDSVKLEELQQKQSAVELTEIKINQLFENVCSAQVTHDDYILTAKNYLPFLENTREDTLEDIGADTLNDLFTIFANENMISLEEKIKHTKSITIAFFFYNMDISSKVLKDYLNEKVKT